MIKNKLKISLVFALVMMFGATSLAGAADLTYSADTTVDLSSPDIDLTIVSGAEATTVVVNAGTVVVTLPVSGNAFTITSASRHLLISGQTAALSSSFACDSNRKETLVLTPGTSVTETVTITPDSVQCVGASGSGSGSYIPPADTTPPTDTSIGILDGDIIQCASSSNPFAVYIVKTVGDAKYIRHIVSLEIFNCYGHLKWKNLKQVDSLDNYSLSSWARVNTGPNNTPGPADKVYEINGDQSKHWINMTAEQFLTHGGSDAAIYTVNQGELDLYTTGSDVMSL